jgi:hypothetical protein
VCSLSSNNNNRNSNNSLVCSHQELNSHWWVVDKLLYSNNLPVHNHNSHRQMIHLGHCETRWVIIQWNTGRRPPQLRDHPATTTKWSQSRMVSSLISINWSSLTRPPRYPDRDHPGTQTVTTPVPRPLPLAWWVPSCKFTSLTWLKGLIGRDHGSNWHLATQKSTSAWPKMLCW